MEALAWHYLFEDDDDDDSDDNLTLEERRRRSRKLPRVALMMYHQSAFKYMFDSGNNQALINCCAVDHKIFQQLLQLFKPVFDSYSLDCNTELVKKLKPKAIQNGRPRKIDAVGCLGLVFILV